MKQIGVLFGSLLALVILLFGSGALYRVNETNQAVITRFGKPIGDPVMRAGLHVKVPFIDRANFFDKRILQWDGDPDAMPTADKKFIFIDTFARWRIVDPLKFYESMRNETRAIGRLNDIINGETKGIVAGKPLIEMVRNSTRTFVVSEYGVSVTDKEILKPISTGRDKITKMILANVTPKLEGFGIVVEDVEVKRINYDQQDVRQKVYERMKSERKRAAERFRSEGKGEKARIEGEIERDLLGIESRAQRAAQEIRGKADKKALRILSRAYGRDPSFFSFYQTLQTYEESLKEDDKFILSTDNDYIKYLKSIRP